jgi:hypothetical protein
MNARSAPKPRKNIGKIFLFHNSKKEAETVRIKPFKCVAIARPKNRPEKNNIPNLLSDDSMYFSSKIYPANPKVIIIISGRYMKEYLNIHGKVMIRTKENKRSDLLNNFFHLMVYR